ncbi:hypothetical protein ES702_04790 [subsurface metagenome]
MKRITRSVIMLWTMLLAILATCLDFTKQTLLAFHGCELGAVGRKWIDVPFSINQATPGVTLGTATAAGSGDGATEAELFTFLAPVGLTVVILPLSTLAAYLLDNEAAPAECGDGTAVRIVHIDSAGDITLNRIVTTYAGIKDFADQNKLKRFKDKFSVGEKEKLICYTIPLTGVSLNPAGSRFEIDCRRVSKMLTV